MKTLRDTFTIAWKDLQILLKDRGLLAIIMLLPLIFGVGMSSLNNSNMDSNRVGGSGFTLKVYLVNDDSGDYGEAVVQTLEGMGVLEMETPESAAAADAGVAEGMKIAAILIPENFSQKISAHETATIQVLVDPSQDQFAGIIQGLMNYAISPVVLQGEIRFGIRSVTDEIPAFATLTDEQRTGVETQMLGVVMTQLQKLMAQPLVSVGITQTAKNPDMPINFFNLIMPGFTVLFAFFLVGSVGESIFREKDEGTFRRLQAAPIGRVAIMSGKMLAFAVIVILQVLLLFGVTASFFKMDLGDSPLGLLLVSLMLSLVVTSFGLMVASLVRTGKQADNISTVLAFVMGGLGGCFPLVGSLTPLFLQENFLAKISQFTPQGQVMMSYYKLLNQGGGVVDVLPHIAILAVMVAVFLAIGVWRLKWR
jgi:ABC-2 type transport system permease protein